MSDYYDYNEYYQRMYAPTPEDICKPPMAPPPLYNSSSDNQMPQCPPRPVQTHTVSIPLPATNFSLFRLFKFLLAWVLFCYVTTSVFQVVFLYLHLPIPFTLYLEEFYYCMVVYWRASVNFILELTLFFWLLRKFAPRILLLSAVVYILDPHLIQLREYLLIIRFTLLQ